MIVSMQIKGHMLNHAKKCMEILPSTETTQLCSINKTTHHYLICLFSLYTQVV